MTYLSQTRKLKVIQVVEREKMVKVKLFYMNIDGEDTYLIAEGETESQAAQNSIQEFKEIQKIYGEQNLPISCIQRMEKIIT